MRINFSDYDLSQFRIQVGTFCGVEDCRLITPQEMGVDWTQQNKIFRSSIWDKDGNLLSGSFLKFSNWGEKSDVFPVPQSLDNTDIIGKIDGSTMIVDQLGFNSPLSIRTRGTFSYKTLANAADFEYVLKRYPKIAEYASVSPGLTFLFEIVTPNQKIVIRYSDEPDIYLIGMVIKEFYTLAPQHVLDSFAEVLGVKRPPRFTFDDISSLAGYIKNAQGIEGCCLYSNHGQDIHKLKSDWYLLRHRLKSQISSFSRVLDLYLSINAPSYDIFHEYLANTFDFELAEYAAPQMKEVCGLYVAAQDEIADIRMLLLANNLTLIPRKDAALMIINEYGKSTLGLQSIAFNLLNGKNIDDRAMTNLILALHKRDMSGLTDKPEATDWMDDGDDE